MAKLSPFPAFISRKELFVLIPFFVCFLSSPLAASGAGSIRDLLRNYGLPSGLLPNSVESFAHDPSSGLLEVRLDYPCYALYDDGLAYFESEVRGNLSYGALSGVVGWSQEELFLWLPVKGIVVTDPTSGVILVDIGVAHKHLPVSVFEDPPDCRPPGEEAAAGVGLFGRREGFLQPR
ncbi:hypothetical protein OPV22_016232 [Ensete ventricosum]|uniref:DUF538 domain-containing protein n=1 Tax=Ensete ventricosum TaxID=4639 RepID=A0AAV8QY68_ENSVE|nr:hypothetical protein OPV22_016232 [Ensete ventricosum]